MTHPSRQSDGAPAHQPAGGETFFEDSLKSGALPLRLLHQLHGDPFGRSVADLAGSLGIPEITSNRVLV